MSKLSKENKNNIVGKETAMKQLELRTYSREEIAEVLGVNIKDTNHFKRNVENKLNKWGYSYEYSRRQFKILRAPTSADERLAEIMIRYYDMDIRTDTVAFSSFLYCLACFPEFEAMPWEERSKWLEDEFGVIVSSRTLQTWCSKFLSSGYIIKNSDYKILWVTGYSDGVKYREMIDTDDKEMIEYFNQYNKRKSELLKQHKDYSKNERWSLALKQLWDEYHCYFYYCKGLQFSAYDNTYSIEMLQEVIELVNEIAEREPAETKLVVEQKIEIL